MKYIALYFFLSFTLLSAAYYPDPSIEPGKAIFKIRKEAKDQLSLTATTTGIESIDRKLEKLKVQKIKHFYTFQSTKSRMDLPDLSLIYEIDFNAQLDPQVAVNLLSRDLNIEYAEPIYIDRVFAIPNDSNYTDALYLASLQAEQAWDIHKGEDGSTPVIIAVVDTGANWKHPDLAENIWQNLGEDANGNGYTLYHNGVAWVMDPGDLNGIDDDGNGFVDDLIGWNFVVNANFDQNNDPSDPGTHGTVVSGIAAARTNNSIGVASLSWNVILMPISCAMPGQTSSIYRGYNAIIYAAENGADVINCSWGGTAFSQASQDAIDYAWGLGSIILAAAGNSNNSTPLYPAAYTNVVAVASLQNNGIKASISNFGAYVDVGAPTGSITSLTENTYTTVSNATSWASPVASALAALIKSYNPSWTREQVVNQLISTCDAIDHLNPSHVNMLGHGKLNALNALSEVNPSPQSKLKLALHKVLAPSDQNNNRAIEAGEQFSVNLTIRNYSFGVSSDNVSYTLSTSDPDITILNNSHGGAIPADGYASLEQAFLIQVGNDISSKYVSFQLFITADVPIVYGANLSFEVLINAGGIFVWEGMQNGRDMSGTYIRDTLNSMGYSTVYGNVFPASFYSFDAVFLSFGMVGSNIVRFNNHIMFYALKEYLEQGGKVYIEGCDAVGFDMAYFLPAVENGLDAHEILWPLLGIQNADDGSTRMIEHLSAHNGWHTHPLLFLSSSQTVNDWIDLFYPNQNGVISFVESSYGPVALESIGAYNQRTMVMSYALSELNDNEPPNTRYELVSKIMDFFERNPLVLPEVRELSIGYTEGNGLNLSWSYPFPVDTFHVYSDSDPLGLFSDLEIETGMTELNLSQPTEQKKFYRVKAFREFGIE